MNKKKLVFFVLIVFLFTFFLRAEKKVDNSQNSRKIITKTYKLKYISPYEAASLLKPYALKIMYSSRTSPFITVRMFDVNVSKFEEVLKKVDVKKRNIFFKIYTITAFRNRKIEKITIPELKSVVKELSSLFSFKSYKVDGISSLFIKEGAKYSKIRLSSAYNLTLLIIRPYIRISNNQKLINFDFELTEGGRKYRKTLIESTTYIKNNTFFIAGVSSLGNTKDSIILVIKAQIME